MTRGEFLVYLLLNGVIAPGRRFIHDPLLLEIITSEPMGYSIYEARVENYWRLGEEVPTDA